METPLPESAPKEKRAKVKQCPRCQWAYDLLSYHLQLCSVCMYSADHQVYLQSPLVPNDG